ncbi:hypothetical protein J4H86_08115 [Spiractinospora alimapuensis]|uniref:hypothetical protein n=1 Tax=Spiractinospora alimapuensis TaxID=2820884 RepID=UPI001F20ED1A|nr:hypothetical protein [Spiractinospora alimapuensis]QVQ53675.1 hypothetical protein J4H86_08115 [Spiractinospora alimapuensis]
MNSVTTPVPRERSRVTATGGSVRDSAAQREIDALRAELTALRATVAHLRASNARVPAQLRPVVDRAVAHHTPHIGAEATTGAA